ncbi:MAG: putative bifunctional diguanylate cyclase/phosphodiesterase [Planctomycetota bacterium]|jgi:diguanylate cyclase (GGDEF)-like protein
MNSRQRVLIIDNSEQIRHLVGARLHQIDVDLVDAENGEQGLAEARKELPDLILLDVRLPDVSGFGVCHQLQGDPLTRDIPIILTGSDDPDDKVRAFEMGAVDYVSKPFHADELRARVTKALKNRALLEMLETQALSDALTGLPNRALLTDRLDQAIKRGEREPDYKFAVLFLDFDRFKIINDSLGHEVGDMLLISIAERLASNLRAGDTATHSGTGHVPARLGGDEFVILLDGLADHEDAVTVAERLQEALAAPHEIGDHDVISTASIGIVTSAGGYDRADDVIRDADTAMYHAKTGGKARHVIFDDRMHQEAVERLELEQDLRRSVDAGEFWLSYQPIVSLSTGELKGFEALMRWSHPQRGPVPPDVFIGLAEEIGLIVPIGRLALREATRQLKDWHERFPHDPPLTMNVNISKHQLRQQNLVEIVDGILRETNLDPASLKLEITESAIMDSPEQVTDLLNRLKGLGVRLCMDDFGTGHSSLSLLHKFPIDVLKIDRTFVLNTDGNREYAAVIHAIITLAHTLNMTVVGEGVETAGQLAQLQALECDAAQGNLFAASMPPAEAEAFMQGPHGLARSA